MDQFLPSLIAALIAVVAFHLAFTSERLGWTILLHVGAVVYLAHTLTPGPAAIAGAIVAVLTIVPQLYFFAGFLKSASLVFWGMLCIFPVAFLAAASWIVHWNPYAGILVMPILWAGIEYFRSELSPFRFAWLTPAHGAVGSVLAPFLRDGACTFGLMAVAVANYLVWPIAYGQLDPVVNIITLGYLVAMLSAIRPPNPGILATVETCSCQVEAGIGKDGKLKFLPIWTILLKLDECIRRAPSAQLFILPEYTLGDAPPEEFRSWCKRHQVYLAVGGRDWLEGGKVFRNTVYVIGPSGKIVFRQSKTVPIQARQVDDGLPATRQEIWKSPWGHIGFLICYDLQFTRVADELIRRGAQALVVCSMDLDSWGQHEHRLHERFARLMSIRYGVDVIRVASSGRSQLASHGRIIGQSDREGFMKATVSLRSTVLPFESWLSEVFGPIPAQNRSRARAA